jgi:hypothetical protein
MIRRLDRRPADAMDKMDDGKTLRFEFAETAKAPMPSAVVGANGTNGTHAAPPKRHKPEKLMRLLSDRNLKLLKMIRTAEPKTLAELSRLSGRPKASLTRTLARLSDLGIVVLVKSKGRGKIPTVACDRVRLEVSLLPEGEPPSGKA